MKLFVAVDVGCIECSEKSHVLGVFETEGEAQAVLDDHERRQEENWRGQHHFMLFEVKNIGTVHRVEY